jgi:hypothetical protein
MTYPCHKRASAITLHVPSPDVLTIGVERQNAAASGGGMNSYIALCHNLLRETKPLTIFIRAIGIAMPITAHRSPETTLSRAFATVFGTEIASCIPNKFVGLLASQQAPAVRGGINGGITRNEVL